ncbi:hypothetical protein SUGI_0689600 [Cryptomeria japonica]|nr:hypothetical protein SUGI_0689600 [Cryptomeria japonica]
MCMPGEDPSDLWETNKMSFNKVKLLLNKGYEKGNSSDEINTIFREYSPQWAVDGAEHLDALQNLALPSVLKHFPNVDKDYVKITVVFSITILIRLHKNKCDRLRKVLRACGELWDLLSFADECDIDLQANEINLYDDFRKDKDQVGMAAEREFYKLQMEYDKFGTVCEECVIGGEEACRILEALSNECEDLLRNEKLLGGEEVVAANLSDSKDWIKIAPFYNRYKLCRLILDNEIEDFVESTEDALRNVIACCLSRLPDMIVKQCWKWAQEFEEDKLWEAVDLAWKCRGMMEAWETEPKLKKNTTKQRTIQEMQSL